MRSMRFPVELHDEESIAGALARGIRKNVLERSSIFFDDAGLSRRKVGMAQAMGPTELSLLANFMGCDVAELLVRASVPEKVTARTSMIAFGNLRLHSSDFEFERRRIAPRTLAEQGFHRQSWLIKLLPYCPVSLERIVDTCPRCGSTIGWARCWGIGVCEWCRAEIPPSDLPPLAPELGRSYREFSRLLSDRSDVRTKAIEGLHADFHSMEPSSIVTTALRLGQVCRDEPVSGIRRDYISQLDASLLGSVIVTGMQLLASWPVGFRNWANAAFNRCREDLAAHHDVRSRIKRLGNDRLEDAAQAKLIRQAMPMEFDSFVHSAAPERHLTLVELKSHAHISPKQVNLIRSELEIRRLPGVKRVRSQFDPKRVEEFATRYRTSLRLRQLTFRLNLPMYALEQMVCLGLLPCESDFAVRTARHGMSVQEGDVAELLADIWEKRACGPLPKDAVRLKSAARCIGGREKPWGEIFRHLRERRLEFWTDNEAVSTKSIKLRAASLVHFQDVHFDQGEYENFPFVQTVKHNEAEEILNVEFVAISDLVARGCLSFTKDGNGLSCPKSDVVALARLLVSPAELGHALGMHPRSVAREVADHVTRIGNCWSRKELIEQGFLRHPS